MPNLVDLPYETHVNLLPFLDYPSYLPLRATSHYFRSLNVKPELLLDKFIRLETEASTKSTFLVERDLLPCYWCSVLIRTVSDKVALLPANRFEDDTKIMAGAPANSPSQNMELYRRCLNCLAKYISGYSLMKKGVKKENAGLTLFAVTCVGGSCVYCVRIALRVSGCSDESGFGTYNSFSGPFFPSMHTGCRWKGCRWKGYCWTCFRGPRPGHDAGPAQIRRRECDECFEKRLRTKSKQEEGQSRATSEENEEVVFF